MLIQVLLLLAVACLLLGFIRWQDGARLQAGKRLAFFGFLAVNVWAVLRPEDVTSAAQLLGVGRGADLLLYALVVAFAFVVIHMYLRFRDLAERFTALARQVALREAELVNRQRGVLSKAAVVDTNGGSQDRGGGTQDHGGQPSATVAVGASSLAEQRTGT